MSPTFHFFVFLKILVKLQHLIYIPVLYAALRQKHSIVHPLFFTLMLL